MGNAGDKWAGDQSRGGRGPGLLVMTEEPGVFLRIPTQGGVGEAGGLGEGCGRSTQIQRPLLLPLG